MESFIVPIVILAALAVGIVIFVLSRIQTVPASRALIISGARSNGETKVVRPGGRSFVIPIIQSYESISLSQKSIPLTVEGVDENSVEVNVSAVAIIKVGSTQEMIRAAAERFVGHKNTDESIARNTQQVLLGSLRAIISKMTIKDLISKREILQKKVLEEVKSELESMGLETESLQIVEITDPNGYIQALGVPESERVSKEARIAKARNNQEANEQEVTSRTLVAEKNRDLSIREAQLKAETDKARAESAASGPLAEAGKRREIAEIEKSAAEARSALREKELDTEVRKPADAEKYSRQQSAEAAKLEQILEAQATAESLKLSSDSEAHARRVRADADAGATVAYGDAEASATTAKGRATADAALALGLAEAESMEKKAEAFKMYNEAAVLELVINKLPEIAKELASPMSNIKDLSIISTDGAGALPKAVANNFGQLETILEKTTGISLKDILNRKNTASDVDVTVEAPKVKQV